VYSQWLCGPSESAGLRAGEPPDCGWQEVEEPQVGINDVLIRVLRPGICGNLCSDLQMGRLGAKDDSGAIVIGHEFCRARCWVASNVAAFSGQIVSG
jgi:threonine 3-dehydrogenase